jgi:hypothetical protein
MVVRRAINQKETTDVPPDMTVDGLSGLVSSASEERALSMAGASGPTLLASTEAAGMQPPRLTAGTRRAGSDAKMAMRDLGSTLKRRPSPCRGLDPHLFQSSLSTGDTCQGPRK